jgi:Na+/H+-dicarboxylate symporter
MNRLQRDGGLPFYYWFLAGLLIGIITGWFFHGTINFIFRMLLLVGVIIFIGLIV